MREQMLQVCDHTPWCQIQWEAWHLRWYSGFVRNLCHSEGASMTQHLAAPACQAFEDHDVRNCFALSKSLSQINKSEMAAIELKHQMVASDVIHIKSVLFQHFLEGHEGTSMDISVLCLGLGLNTLLSITVHTSPLLGILFSKFPNPTNTVQPWECSQLF